MMRGQHDGMHGVLEDVLALVLFLWDGSGIACSK